VTMPETDEAPTLRDGDAVTSGEDRSGPGIVRFLRRRPDILRLVAVAAVVGAALSITGVVPTIAALAAVALLGAAGILVLLAAEAENALSGVGRSAKRRMTGADPRLRHFEGVLQVLHEPAMMIDARSRIIFGNDAARTVMGTVEAGTPISFVLRAPQIAELIRDAMTGEQPEPVTYQQRVPVDRWFEVRAVRLPSGTGPDGRAAPLLAVFLRDLTAEQRIEQMRADFVANASHELRTPLASLSGFIETLQGPARNDPEARDRFLEIMATQADRMARLIDDLMSLGRIELRAHMPPEDIVDLGSVARQTIDALKPLADDAAVQFVLELPDAPLLVRGDADELTQVAQNLIENAVKYAHTGKLIEITGIHEVTSSDLRRVVLSVRDFGPGIPPEHLPRLTERFYRVDVDTSRDKGGTGLGLAIVKHILNRHRGALMIESNAGQGALFTIRLDAATDAEAEAGGHQQPRPATAAPTSDGAGSIESSAA
jgi:two-component system phosphate regulon sensor histidine kinase PhoR